MLGQGLRDVVGAFGSEPDPKMCYLDPARRQAALRILSGIEKDESFFVLTGQEGIGKTTLLSHLALRLHERDGVLPLCPRGSRPAGSRRRASRSCTWERSARHL